MLQEGGSKLFYPSSLLSEIRIPNCINELFSVGMSFRQMKENFHVWICRVQKYKHITSLPRPWFEITLAGFYFLWGREGKENSQHCAFSDYFFWWCQIRHYRVLFPKSHRFPRFCCDFLERIASSAVFVMRGRFWWWFSFPRLKIADSGRCFVDQMFVSTAASGENHSPSYNPSSRSFWLLVWNLTIVHAV